ncbi:glycosyl transferase family 90 [Campylobacter sp. CCS1377]|uniref:Glycosyl transferase family 90 n=1 Tax=Campylobacter sp. CCS1377 TaxID=3158229 RepID=A0AAU7E6C7_9BACT
MSDCRFVMNVKGIGVALIPRIFFQRKLKDIFSDILKYDAKNLAYISERVGYYNKINSDFSKDLQACHEKEKIGKLPFKKTSLAYDGYKISKYFKDDLLWVKKYGDINCTFCPPPVICKSRPLNEKNYNNIILKLDKNRHFVFLEDKMNFENKQNKAVFRGAIYQKHRKEFFERYFGSSLCDLGCTNNDYKMWRKGFLSKQEQMKYKFIISLEGNDVASNLKWALSSNSLVLSPKMTCETWFMEGKLVPNEHFILVDENNLEEQICYYNAHPKKALQIIQNAHEYIEQFLDEKREFYIGILVLAKYFYYSNQLELDKDILELIKG